MWILESKASEFWCPFVRITAYQTKEDDVNHAINRYGNKTCCLGAGCAVWINDPAGYSSDGKKWGRCGLVNGGAG